MSFGTVRPRAFCLMSLRVTLRSEAKPIGGAVAKESLNRATELRGVDPKRDDLPMARVKSR